VVAASVENDYFVVGVENDFVGMLVPFAHLILQGIHYVLIKKREGRREREKGCKRQDNILLV
jgi:hypothetical protein